MTAERLNTHRRASGNVSTLVTGSTVLITGAARGMGELYAQRAAREGASAIALWDIDLARAQTLADELNSATTRVRAYGVDISRLDALTEAATRTRAELGA